MKQMNAEIEKRIQMIKENKVPEGYKRSKRVGIIPNKWCENKFNKCIKIANGQIDPNKAPYSNMKHIGLANIEKMTGRLLYANKSKNENLTSGKYYFDSGTVLYGKIRPELGKVVYLGFEGICSADIYPLKPLENLESQYLKYALMDSRFYQFAVSVSMRTGMPKINREDISSYYFALPPKYEQEKIAEVLTIWDKAINLKQKLISEKEKQKQGLCERLLSGNVRLKGFKDKWEKVKLGSVLDTIDKKAIVTPVDYKLLTVKLHVKGIEATDKVPKETENGRPYYIREPGELLIGRQNLHNGGIGIVPSNMKNYIASNAVTSLKVINGDLKFYFYYLSNKNFYKRIGNLIGGTGQKEISENMLKKLELIIPRNIEEQKQIANILTTADKEIDLLKKELNELKDQKKGLMQLLLTGIVRVKCD